MLSVFALVTDCTGKSSMRGLAPRQRPGWRIIAQKRYLPEVFMSKKNDTDQSSLWSSVDDFSRRSCLFILQSDMAWKLSFHTAMSKTRMNSCRVETFLM